MKDWLQKAQISNPKCAIYMAIGGLQIMVAGDYQWTEVCLASLIAWKTFMSEPSK